MKKINKSLLTSVGILLGTLGCSDPELPTPNTFTSGATYKAYFSFANATTDAPSLDFYVNGVKLGTAVSGAGSSAPTTLQIATPGTTGGVTANTSIRAKATTGTIGGLLGSNDLIFRATANGTGIFAATNLATYTVIAIDSIQRPIPRRLNRFTATIAFADLTYFNPNILPNGAMISASRRDSLNPANCPACINWDGAAQTPSTATEFANLVAYGTGTSLIPLGLTDVGGVRFYVATDAPLTFTAGTLVTDAGIRVVNAVSNANNITAVANTNGTFGGPPLFVRLNGGVPINLTNVGAPNATNAFVGGVAGGFNPSAGSRTAGAVAFTTRAIAAASVPNVYTLQVATDNAFTNIVYSAANVSFVPGKNYTIFIKGKVKTLTGIQSTISHGIITH